MAHAQLAVVVVVDKKPFAGIRQAAELSDSVIVGVSGGKDSLCCLQLAADHFKHVEAYHLYLVPEISFVEQYLTYLEKRYQITIHRRPHWMLSQMFREGTFRPMVRSCPVVKITDIEAAERERTGLNWICTGQKASDSLERRGYYAKVGAVDEKHHRICPIVWWTDKAVYAYLKAKRIPLPPDYRLFGRSWGGRLYGKDLIKIREQYPDDYRKIKEVFPYIGSQIARYELSNKAPGIPDREGASEPTESGTVQPEAD